MRGGRGGGGLGGEWDLLAGFWFLVNGFWLIITSSFFVKRKRELEKLFGWELVLGGVRLGGCSWYKNGWLEIGPAVGGV